MAYRPAMSNARTCRFSLLALALGVSACGDSGEEDPTQTSSSSSGPVGSSGDASTSGGTTSGDGGSTTEVAASSSSESGASTSTVSVSGHAFNFGPNGGRVVGATVRILEMPDRSTTTVEDGYFEFPDLPAEAEATFVFEHEGFPVTYTKTFTLPGAGERVERVTFQVPNDGMYDLLATVAAIEPDPDTCQIASTVTRVGKSLYDAGAHGEEGATIAITPALPAEHGPIYFNASVLPERELTETSVDGGILYTNVPPGTYHIEATKDGVEFEAVDITCEAGVLVNPSPPHGLQALEG